MTGRSLIEVVSATRLSRADFMERSARSACRCSGWLIPASRRASPSRTVSGCQPFTTIVWRKANQTYCCSSMTTCGLMTFFWPIACCRRSRRLMS